MKIELGPFARSGIESFSGADVASGVEQALERYAARLSWREVTPPPRRFLDRDERASGEMQTFMVTVRAGTRTALELEAQRQEVTMEEIMRHAVSIYLAEMDIDPGAGNGDGGVNSPVTPLFGLTS